MTHLDYNREVEIRLECLKLAMGMKRESSSWYVKSTETGTGSDIEETEDENAVWNIICDADCLYDFVSGKIEFGNANSDNDKITDIDK